MLDVLDSDYVRMARLKGLREQRVILVHALRNASIPIVTLLGVRLGRLISGAVLVEVVFAWPGIGRVMVEAVSNRDFPVVQAGVLLFGVSFIIANFIVDMTYAALDPRVRG
jgi:peptide/nickel transport system permease protein